MQTKKTSADCVFCAAAQNPAEDKENLVVVRAAHAFVILNRYPYTSGHLMIVPYHHVAKLTDVSAAGAAEMMELARRAEDVLEAVYAPDGLNMGMNVGAAAGAGIAQHLHIHMLPRWSGDANFMTTVGHARIIPESLVETYAKVTEGFAAVPKRNGRDE